MSIVDGGPVVYGLLTYKDSLLFTKLPFALFSNLPTSKPSLISFLTRPSSSCLSFEDQTATAAILDLLQYYHVVNMCTSARVSKSKALLTHITYSTTTAEQGPSTRRIRRFIMDPNVSLLTFDRDFLNNLMLERFESPFNDDFCQPGVVYGRENMVIQLVHPEKFGSWKTSLSQILETSKTMSRDHSRENRRESYWKRMGIF